MHLPTPTNVDRPQTRSLRRRALWALLVLIVAAFAVVTAWDMSESLRLTAAKALMPTLDIPPGTDRYDAKLRRVFAEAYDPDITLRCLCTGGMAELVVFLKNNELVMLRTSGVWAHETREMILDGKSTSLDATGKPRSKWDMFAKYEDLPLRLENLPVDRTTTAISADLQAKLRAVWQDALDHASRKKEWRIGCDGGTNTYFLRTADGHDLAGSIWSPDTGPAAAIERVVWALLTKRDGQCDTSYVAEAIQAYWHEAQIRTPASLELDFNESPLSISPSR